jgi:hypothetical protein
MIDFLLAHEYSVMAKTVDWESASAGASACATSTFCLRSRSPAAWPRRCASARTQPAVSKAIGDLEAAVGARLLDRGPHGVEATMYGQALLKSGLAAFDELGRVSGISNTWPIPPPASCELDARRRSPRRYFRP